MKGAHGAGKRAGCTGNPARPPPELSPAPIPVPAPIDMPELRILITRRTDGGSVLRCERADGTVSWQRLDGPQAAFFPMHDLTHFAVETVLAASQGFFGLVAAGWDIADTTGKGARGVLPAEAVAIERIVGFLDVERASGGAWSAEEFNEQMRLATSSAGAVAVEECREVTDDELSRIRARRRELFGEWARLRPGESMELAFDRPATARSVPAARGET